MCRNHLSVRVVLLVSHFGNVILILGILVAELGLICNQVQIINYVKFIDGNL